MSARGGMQINERMAGMGRVADWQQSTPLGPFQVAVGIPESSRR